MSHSSIRMCWLGVFAAAIIVTVTRWARCGVLLLAIVLSSAAWAERHALLVGIGEYRASSDWALDGPVNDVAELSQVLQSRWRFTSDRIERLTNAEATRANILDALERLFERTREGDVVFLYFSGHGTSAYDPNNAQLAALVPDRSGAFVPYDFPASASAERQAASLIIGQRDLKPLLSQFDSGGRQVFVAIDSCYSGNAVRSTVAREQTELRFRVLPGPRRTIPFEDDFAGESALSGTTLDDEYPYRNVVFLGGASERELALDISARDIPIRFTTLSGKPHGAFSDALLRVLSGDLVVDRNGDGLSYLEVYTATQRYFDTSGIAQTPQLLPKAYQDARALVSRRLFDGPAGESVDVGSEDKDDTRESSRESAALRLAVLGVESSLLQRIEAEPALIIVEQRPDVQLQHHGSGLALFSGAGDLIVDLPANDPEAVIARLLAQAKVERLLALGPGRGAFELRMELRGGGIVLQENEALQLAIRADKAVHLLLFNINSHADVELLYPYDSAEMAARDGVDIPEGFSVVVQPPFGSDHLIAYGFINLPPLVRRFQDHFRQRPAMAIDSPLMRQLSELLQAPSTDYRRATQKLVTIAKAEK